MKKYVAFLGALFTSSILFAGNGSGTLFVAIANENQIVVPVRLNGEVNFNTAQLVNGVWKIEKIQIDSSLLSPNVKSALLKSLAAKTWAPLEN